MGSDPNDRDAFDDEKPVHRLFLPAFQIARTPVTNAQYVIYIQAAGAEPPLHWEDGQPPKEKLEHPVVYVSWHDACGYCTWLSQLIRKQVRLPTEAEWEKAARGDKDKRPYPWGETFDMVKCNSAALGLGDTTPVGVFPAGASPYGCLDMAGNVLEWTWGAWSACWGEYPYNPHDGREDLAAQIMSPASCGAAPSGTILRLRTCAAPFVTSTTRASPTTSWAFAWRWRVPHDGLLWISGLCSSDLWGSPEGDISLSGGSPRIADNIVGLHRAVLKSCIECLNPRGGYLWHSLLRPGKRHLPSVCPTGGSACSREGSPLCTPLSRP